MGEALVLVRIKKATTWYFSANWRAFFSISSLSDRAVRDPPQDSFSYGSFDLPDSLVSSSLYPSTRVVPRPLTDSRDSAVLVNPLSKSFDVVGNTFLCFVHTILLILILVYIMYVYCCICTMYDNAHAHTILCCSYPLWLLVSVIYTIYSSMTSGGITTKCGSCQISDSLRARKGGVAYDLTDNSIPTVALLLSQYSLFGSSEASWQQGLN